MHSRILQLIMRHYLFSVKKTITMVKTNRVHFKKCR